jgi:hypothetical protein
MGEKGKMISISLRPVRRAAARVPLTMLLSGLLLAGLVASLPARAAEQTCRQKRIADIPARIAPEHRLLISADLDGRPVELLLDSGIGVSALNRSLILEIGLPVETTHDIRYQTAFNNAFKIFADPAADGREKGFAGAELNERTRIPKMRLGGATTEYEEFAVIPVGGDGRDGQPVGVFGMDYLLLYDLELDPAAGRVRLFEQDRCGDQAVYWSRNYSVLPLSVDPVTRWVTTEVELDGQKLRALIDTGREHTTMPLGAADRVFGLTESSPGVEPAGSETTLEGRSMALYAYSFKTLKLGDLVVNNPRITLEPLRLMRQTPTNSHIARAAEVGPDIVIGENLLRRMRIYFAFKESTAYFTLIPPAP